VRLVIAGDEALLREGLVLLLARAGLQVVGTTGTAAGLVDLVDRLDPDVVVTDTSMPPGHGDDGLQAALRLRRARPGRAVVVLSQHVQRRYALELVGDDPRGVGYLLKQRIADADGFAADVRRVGEGGTVLDPEVVDVVVQRAGSPAGSSAGSSSVERLTGRQQQVLALVAQGRTNAAIASRLGITERAVVQHTSNIYAELGLPTGADDHRRVLAALRYLAS
jgi:DNA-binding NarL/FixJ family response regulator